MLKFIRYFTIGRIVPILMVLFFLEMGSFFVIANQNRFKILVLHSYTSEYTWSHGINQGLARVLTDKKWVGDKWIDLSYHYMATKNFDADQKRRAQKTAHRNIKNLKPDILIAIDDYANSLVAKEYVNNGSMNIIFAGVNGSVAPYGYEGANNVSGIYEHKPVVALVELINIINRYNKELSSVIFVSDESESAQLDADHMQGADWGRNVLYKGHIVVNSFSEWKKVVLNLPDDVDYLLVGGYRKLRLLDDPGKWASSNMVAQWTAKNSKPMVIGLNVFNSEDGTPLSVGVSPYEQGEVIGNMALELIKTGQPAGVFAHVYPNQYVVSVNVDTISDDSKARREIPRLLEAFARATNNYHQ